MTGYPINRPDDPTVLDVPTDILCSYHYFSGIDMAAIQSWGTRIIGDSGAFSAMSSGTPIDRDKFHEWADRWRDALFWTASLDVIGDPEATYTNWQAARADGLELVPTVHYGEGTEQLDRFAEEGATLIGLGGMVPYSSEKDRLMRWCLQMHRHARDHHPQVRFHGWGISHPYLVDNLPWWSTDSSGFSSCFRFGTLRLWVPKRARFVSVDLNGRDLAKHARLLRETYGIDWRKIAESTPANRRPLGRVALRSVQLYAAWLQKRQAVTPPALLVPKLTAPETGPLQAGEHGSSASQVRASIRPPRKDAVGPQPVAAVGSAAETRYFDPSNRGAPISEPRMGPRAAAAMDAMQPSKALSPDDAEPPAVGPLQPEALGSNFSGQGQAFTPDGSSVKEAAGPYVAAAAVVNEPIQNCLGAATSSDLARVRPGTGP